MDAQAINKNATNSFEASNEQELKRSLGLKEGITITVGMVVGVGLFTVGANCVGMMGSMIIVATFVALLISYWPALLYAEMGAALPFAGGTYNYAQKGTNRFFANLAGWNYIIGCISCCGGETLAFSNYFTYFFKGIGIEINVDPRIIAAILLIVFVTINFRGVKLASKWQNSCMFFFWACSLVWFITMAPNINMENFLGGTLNTMPDAKSFITIVGLIWWCFAGFETAVGMGGEIKYPQINIPRIMKVAPLFVFAITALFQWFLVGLVPSEFYEILQNADAPYAEGLISAGIVGFPLILLCFAIAFGGDLSTINPGVGGPARYIFQMSKEGCLPAFFSKIHPKYKTPYVAVLTVGIITLLLVSTNSIIYIASLSLFAILFCYIIGFISFIGLRIKEKDLKRPYKAPAGILGALVSIIIYFILMTQIGTEALVSGIIFCAISITFYLVKTRIKNVQTNDVDINELIEENYEVPSEEEEKKMKTEYKVWMAIGILLTIIALLAFIISYL